jgi:hypothetical protein
VTDLSKADVAIVAARFSLLCHLRRQYGIFAQWGRVVETAPHAIFSAINGSTQRPLIATHVETSCKDPWSMGSKVMRAHVTRLRDLAKDAHDVVAPAVVSGRAWLARRSRGGDDVPSPQPWRQRPFLFFAGHIPKLHISPLRYQLWRRLRGADGVTAISSTINCTVGPMQICNSSTALRDARVHTWPPSHCSQCPVPADGVALCALQARRHVVPELLP